MLPCPWPPPAQLWLEFRDEPVLGEREMLEGVLKSWFAVGKLGGYNSQNLQVAEGKGGTKYW